MAKRRGFPPVYKIERVEKMSAKRVFFGVLQKIVVVCCAIFFGFANAFSANLPSGYTELEYIESTGSQYINTEIGTSSITKTEVVGQFTGLVSNTFIFGKTNGTSRYGWGEYIYLSGANKFLWNYGGWDVVTNADLNKHTFGIDTKNGLVYIDNTQFDTSRTSTGGANPAFVSDNLPIYLFARNSGGVSGYAKAKIYSVKMWNNNELTHDFVPAKNSSGVVGMYDTVGNRFYTNAGTGEFTAGPVVLDQCRNLFDGSIEYGSIDNTGVPIGATTNRVRPTHTITIPAGTYTVSCANGYQIYGVVNGISWSGSGWATGSKTFTVSDPTNTFIFALRNASNPTAELDLNTAFNIQLEQGSTATAYVPFCATPIKIATTAYNAARFNPVKTDLNNAVATIREIVTKTINQTAAIASLQADKQTRPEDACPAGKKCLLVETEENGVIVPHWFPIIEAPE